VSSIFRRQLERRRRKEVEAIEIYNNDMQIYHAPDVNIGLIVCIVL